MDEEEKREYIDVLEGVPKYVEEKKEYFELIEKDAQTVLNEALNDEEDPLYKTEHAIEEWHKYMFSWSNENGFGLYDIPVKNKLFVDAMISAAETVKFDPEETTMICGAIYSTYVMKDLDIDLVEALLRLGAKINQDQVNGLQSITGYENAIRLAVASHSNFYAFDRVRNVTSVLLSYCYDLSAQDVEHVYEKVYNTTSFRDVFSTIAHIEDNKHMYVGSMNDAQKKYLDTIIDVAYQIVNIGLSSYEIKIILEEYRCKFGPMNFSATHRFDKYPRISAVRNEMLRVPWV